MSDMALGVVVENLSYRKSCGIALLEDISFELEAGSILAIAGPNGAGKTTLMNLISGMENFDEGNVKIEGRSLKSLKAEERASMIAIVGQHSYPDKRLRLIDYVALGQMPILGEYSSLEHEEHLKRILSITNLTHLAEKSISQLSGGECQRAHIARALVQRPKLLFLDEPTNHLDPDAKAKMLSLVAALGITVVMVVHDLVMIPEFATHAALMQDARLYSFGSVTEVLTPKNVRETFGVDYLLLPYAGRQVPALDIRRTAVSI